MDFIHKNITAIQKKRPHLYKVLLNHFKQQDLNHGSEIFKTAPWGCFNLRYVNDRGEQKTVYTRDPQQEYERSVKISQFNEARIVIFDGVGLGYHLIEFLKSRPESVRDLVVVEKYPDIFVHALKVHDLTALIESEEFEFFVGPHDAGTQISLKQYLIQRERLIYLARVGHFYFEPSLKEDGEHYLQFARMLEEAHGLVKDAYTTSAEDNVYGLYNILQNSERASRCPVLYDHTHAFKGCPAVVVGAGPSLRGHLEGLKKNQNRMLIACTDAALSTLVKNGITPHIIVCSERTANQQRLFADLPRDCPIPLVTLPTTHPGLFANYPGPIFLFGRISTYGLWLWRESAVGQVGVGVSSLAYCALALLGCAPIFLLGQDFSFDPETGNPYAAGSSGYLHEVNSLIAPTEIVTIKGQGDRTLTTTIWWQGFLWELEGHIVEHGVPTFNVIAADRGALIQNCERIDPADFWQDVEKKFLPREFSWEEFTHPLNQRAGLRGLSAKIQATRQYLQTLSQQTLAAMDAVMLDFYEGFLSHAQAAEIEKVYASYVQRWREKQEALINIDRDLFYLFVNCTFGPAHITLMAARESLPLDPHNRSTYVYHYFFKTMEWFRQLSSWSTRLEHLLQHKS